MLKEIGKSYERTQLLRLLVILHTQYFMECSNNTNSKGIRPLESDTEEDGPKQWFHLILRN